jgi:hypothetical protein
MQTFNQYASKNIRVDSDHAGLFCQVPSQNGTWARVACVESKTSVFASHCSCYAFSKKQHCSHVELVQAYWAKIYAPKVEPVKIEAPKVVKTRKPRNGLVRKVRNGGLVKVEQPAPVAKIIELPVQPAKVTDISTRGDFGTRAFSLMR